MAVVVVHAQKRKSFHRGDGELLVVVVICLPARRTHPTLGISRRRTVVGT